MRDVPSGECSRTFLAGLVALALALALHAASAQAVDGATLQLRADIGERLFFDSSLSEPPGHSCASCHVPAIAFTGDNGSKLGAPRGSRADAIGTRNSPTLMYLSRSPKFGWIDKEGKRTPVGGFFWDGRADSLAEQARGPLFNPIEMNNADVATLVKKIASGPHADALRKAWGADVFAEPDRALTAITESIAAFERTDRFAPFTSKFDAFVQGRARLTPQEERGQTLFLIAQKGNCAACHTLDPDSKNPRDSLFTDFSYHAVGVPRNESIARAGRHDLGLCDSPRFGGPEHRQWCGFFKVPTLRNVALTAPYMHNGRFTTLREAVAFYATRDTNPERWYPQGRKFDDLPPVLHGNVDVEMRPYHRSPGQRPALKEDEIDDIVAFLNTLTDGWKAGGTP